MTNNPIYAVLDLGTNTFHLLIAEIKEGKIHKITHAEEGVKLGEGGIAVGIITEPAFNRGIEALKKIAEKIKGFKVEKVRAVGTAALRSAKNGGEFIETVRNLTGIEIELIEGWLEAELIYTGVKHALEIDDNSLIIDIGGGSVEFVFCNPTGILWKKSFPIGAAKLTAFFHHADPISKEEVAEMHGFFREQLQELTPVIKRYRPETLIGSAGAFESFAALCAKADSLPLDLSKQTSFSFNLDTFNRVAVNLLKTTHAQREAMPDIIPVRVDMIISATVLTQYILELTKVREMKLSTFALKEGLLYSLA